MKEEQAIQAAVMKWWAYAHRGLGVHEPRLLMHIPNGGGRRKIEACILKGQGVRPGVPDLFLAAPRVIPAQEPFWPTVHKHGLWIELKAGAKGHVSELQRSMHSCLQAQGYDVSVCRSFDATVKVITEYLSRS